MKLNRKTISIIFVFVLFIICSALLLLLRNKASIKVDYCTNIGKRIENLKLKQFQLSIIDYEDTHEKVIFYFHLKNKNEYNNDECVEDISKVRKYVTAYLNENNSNELNNKMVKFIFETLPGDSISMSNYNNNEKLINPAQFQFFSFLNVNLS